MNKKAYKFQINGIININTDYKPDDNFNWDMELGTILFDIFHGHKKSFDPNYVAGIHHLNVCPEYILLEDGKDPKQKTCVKCDSPDIEIFIDETETPVKTKERYICKKCGNKGIISVYLGLFPSNKEIEK